MGCSAGGKTPCWSRWCAGLLGFAGNENGAPFWMPRVTVDKVPYWVGLSLSEEDSVRVPGAGVAQ